MSIGENIKMYRNKKGLTQPELGKLIHKSESSIRKYESGNVTPSIDILKTLANKLDVSIDDLMANTEEKNIADALFDGNVKTAMYNTISEKEMNYLKSNLINKYAGNDKSPAEIKAYFDLIYYLIRQNFFGNIRESFEFFDNISPEDFEDIMKDLKAVAIGKITLLKIKKK